MLTMVVESVEEGMYPYTTMEFLCIFTALKKRRDCPLQTFDHNDTIRLNVDDAVFRNRSVKGTVGWVYDDMIVVRIGDGSHTRLELVRKELIEGPEPSMRNFNFMPGLRGRILEALNRFLSDRSGSVHEKPNELCIDDNP